MNITQISEHDYIFNTSARALTSTSLVHASPDGLGVLIDTGCSAEEEIFKEFDRRGIHIQAGICTHLHWDHVANNPLIHQRGGKIYASIDELAPYLTGAPQAVQNVTGIYSSKLSLFGETYRLIPTPGHSPGHIAVVSPDNICHLGDALLGHEEILLSKLPFMEDIKTALRSMVKIEQLDYASFVIAHTGVCDKEELIEIITLNAEKQQDLYDRLHASIVSPIELEDLAVNFMISIGINKPEVLNHKGWRLSVKQRAFDLAREGLLNIEGTVVSPLF